MVFGNRVLRLLRQRRKEIIGDSRKLHNEELHNFYSSSNKIRIIKSRKMRWGEHVERIEGKRYAHRILLEGQNERHH
jgi:hypothetical protein